MDFIIKITHGAIIKEYAVPNDVEVQCGSTDEITENAAAFGVRCMFDIKESTSIPTVLHQIKEDCIKMENYDVQCLYDGVAIYEQSNLTSVKYRLIKMRDATSIREEVTFYGQ